MASIFDWIRVRLFFMALALKHSGNDKGSDIQQVSTLKSPEDERDFKIGLGAAELEDDIRLDINPYDFVEDQLNMPSCSVNGITSGIEAWFKHTKIQIPGYVQLSRRDLYISARKIYGTYPSITALPVRDALKAAQKTGICPEKLCPYTYAEINTLPDKIAQGFRWWKIDTYYRLSSIDDMRLALRWGYPVMLATYINNSFQARANIPILFDPNEPINKDIGHLYFCWRIFNSEQNLYCVNSWGRGYKDKGCMTVPYGYWRNLGMEAWTFTVKSELV